MYTIITMDSIMFSILALPGIVFYAGYTTFMICYFLNKEFFSPEMKLADLNSIKIRSIPPLICSSALTLYSYNRMDVSYHSWVKFSTNMAAYLVFVELLYYSYHRLIHTRYFYKIIHSYHHTKINTYPIDFLNSGAIDFYMYIACLHLPTFIIPMNISEYLIGIYFFTTVGFITHTDIITISHTSHHRNMLYNYCLLFPIFDKCFNTYRITN